MVYPRAGGRRAGDLLEGLKKHYSTLAFARRWLEEWAEPYRNSSFSFISPFPSFLSMTIFVLFELIFVIKLLTFTNVSGYPIKLKQLCDQGYADPYPPIVGANGTYIAQFEHTVFLKSGAKEVYDHFFFFFFFLFLSFLSSFLFNHSF